MPIKATISYFSKKTWKQFKRIKIFNWKIDNVEKNYQLDNAFAQFILFCVI